MPGSDFQQYLFLVPQFLDVRTSASIRSEASPHPPRKLLFILKAPMSGSMKRFARPPAFTRRGTISAVHAHLLTQKSALEDHFRLTLTDCERPQFLHYREGDFFVRHQDGNTEQLEFDHLKVRRISIVVCLNAFLTSQKQILMVAAASTFTTRRRWQLLNPRFLA